MLRLPVYLLLLFVLVSSPGWAHEPDVEPQSAERWLDSVVLLVTFLTEVTSNTATANVLLPIIADLAIAMGLAPPLLMLPATLAASCAFMLPVATPPNAIVYGSQLFRIGHMVKAGVWLNIGTAVVITLWTLTWGRWLFDW